MNSVKNKPASGISDMALAVSNALAEDIRTGDITCETVLDVNPRIKARIISKQKNIIVCGLEVLREVFAQVDPGVKVRFNVKEGSFLRSETEVCSISGAAKSILLAERTALNFLGRLSGIATRTYNITQKIKKYKAKVLDTRKTTPGLRALEKYAVLTGGGRNHRFGLFDQVLIKDNHIQIMKKHSESADLCDMITSVRGKIPSAVKIEIEVDDLKKFQDAIKGSPDMIMLDNMPVRLMKQAVKLRNKTNKKVKLEASGNVTEKSIVKIAACGVDFISMGALTHSVECVDYSLKSK